jgi:hypothetical protein
MCACAYVEGCGGSMSGELPGLYGERLSSCFSPGCLLTVWVHQPTCASQFSVPVTNIWDNQLIQRKVTFWFTVVKVSVHDWLTSLLLGGWWSSYGSTSGSKNERMRKGLGSQDPFKDMPPMIWRSPSRPHLLMFYYLSIVLSTETMRNAGGDSPLGALPLFTGVNLRERCIGSYLAQVG